MPTNIIRNEISPNEPKIMELILKFDPYEVKITKTKFNYTRKNPLIFCKLKNENSRTFLQDKIENF